MPRILSTRQYPGEGGSPSESPQRREGWDEDLVRENVLRVWKKLELKDPCCQGKRELPSGGNKLALGSVSWGGHPRRPCVRLPDSVTPAAH